MEQYSFLAGVYDQLNADFDYNAYADFISALIKENERDKTSLVLDLACGTGKMTLALRELGYDMTGIDLSENMLAVARQVCYDKGITDVLWLNQDMTAFELYGTVDACVCCLDSINYLTRLCDVQRCFELVHNYLIPNGIFIFDINTKYRFEHIYGNNDFILENDGSLCAWHNEYNEKTGICKFYLSIFNEIEPGIYERYDEVQREKCYSVKKICSLLEKCGFELIATYGDINGSELNEKSEKCYLVARCIKEN